MARPASTTVALPRWVGRVIALLERTRDAVAGKNPSDLANDLRRAAGLPAVP
jgi:hypothetical protein